MKNSQGSIDAFARYLRAHPDPALHQAMKSGGLGRERFSSACAVSFKLTASRVEFEIDRLVKERDKAKRAERAQAGQSPTL